MKISIEATPLYQNKNIPRAGIAQYVYQVATRMIQDHPENHYTLFANKFGGGELSADLNLPHVSQKVVTRIPGKLWNIAARKNIMPPLEVFMPASHDVYWFTNFRTYSTARKRRRLTSIYDVAFGVYPEFIQKKNLAYLRDQVPRTLRLADKIITISESARDDMIRLFNADPDKMVIAPCGVDTGFFRPTKNLMAIKSLGIAGKYLLFVGTIEPRKNLERIIQAYDKLPVSYREEYSLVLAGGRGWNDEAIQTAVHRSRKVGKVIVTGYVADEVIPVLYSQATAVLYPSLYEGFGLPIIEALACGTPVLTARNSSLEEVAGKAALYVDEFSETEIRDGIMKLIDSSTVREKIVRSGIDRVKKYNWSITSEIIHEAITR